MKRPSPVAAPLSPAHAALLADLRKVEEVLRANHATDQAAVRVCLDSTRKDMVEHFRAQEQHSSMDTIQRQQPYLATAIHRLAEDHRVLRESLDALIAEVAATPALDEALTDRIRAWIGRVRRHEAREIDFLQDAVDQDIGEKD